MFLNSIKTGKKILFTVANIMLLFSLATFDYSSSLVKCLEKKAEAKNAALSKLKTIVREKKYMEELIRKFGKPSFPPPEERFRALLALMDKIKSIDPNAKVSVSPTPDYRSPLDKYTVVIEEEAYSWDKIKPFIETLYRWRYPLISFKSMEINKTGEKITVAISCEVIMRFGSGEEG